MGTRKDVNRKSNTNEPRRIKSKKFIPSFGKERKQPLMKDLMCWEYGRTWLQEHQDFTKQNVVKEKKKIRRNDFSWWLEKRGKKVTKK